MSEFDAADRFLKDAAEKDPSRWAEIEELYPVMSKYDHIRAKLGEPISRRRKRQGKQGGYVPKEKRRRLSDDEWEESRRAKARYLKEWEEDFRYAKELADEGM